MRRRRRRRQLSTPKRLAMIAVACVQITLLVLALRDLRQRPAEDIRGPKIAWVLASFVNFVGPLAYFVAGRRRDERPPERD